MERDSLSRRTALTLTASSALTTVGVARTDDGAAADDDSVSRDSFVVREGTDQETTVYVTTADAEGPTVVVVGGLHGNEVAGYVAAGEIADWPIDAGRLVTIPEANAVAIDRGTRTDDEGVDLNRQFPEGSEPAMDLARAIWGVVTEYDADVVVDLHESTGIYAGDPVDGVGQAIFRSDGGTAAETAVDAVEYVNRNYVDDPDRAFQTGRFSSPSTEPNGLLVHKAARDLDAESYLVETLSTDVDLETRVQWHSAIAGRLVGDHLFSDGTPDGIDAADDVDEDPDESEDSAGERPDGADREPPIARINTVPAWAPELDLEPGQTVTLDGSCSCAPDGDLVCYEWRIGQDGTFDETGETIDVTIGATGDHPIVLRVTDDAGLTDTAELTLSTD
ncbi:succinylglutamate desuccinylase/aspartoacylase family protein [Halosolutus amylolyticus]|uniref:Succinylglutamate desuccinylase/aspartoacylase family protein n=1 Tax=Halosolutus amylolyticus TaxID=2932267 RepID=A0ABD5PVN0_9EURY|nr:succinylglutamate desuccinylase/aspartoacylase family protein [Halosolutus amylolyticus]